jgi:hypothetical protein
LYAADRRRPHATTRWIPRGVCAHGSFPRQIPPLALVETTGEVEALSQPPLLQLGREGQATCSVPRCRYSWRQIEDGTPSAGIRERTQMHHQSALKGGREESATPASTSPPRGGGRHAPSPCAAPAARRGKEDVQGRKTTWGLRLQLLRPGCRKPRCRTRGGGEEEGGHRRF